MVLGLAAWPRSQEDSKKRCQAQPLQQRLQECGLPGPLSTGGAENDGKEPRWGPLSPQGQRDQDRIAGQVSAANKKH